MACVIEPHRGPCAPTVFTKTSLSQKKRVDPHAEHTALTAMAAADAPVYEAIVDQQEGVAKVLIRSIRLVQIHSD